MALDTASKRGSAIHVGSPWRGRLPIPDGAIGQGDRQHTAFYYSGIAAGEAATDIDGSIKLYNVALRVSTIENEQIVGSK